MSARAWLGAAALALSLLAPRAHAQSLEPPRVVHLPDLELPDDFVPPEDGTVEVYVVVGVDGRATIESCDETEQICALVEAALSEATFEPATRDGAAVPARVALRFRVRQDPQEAQSPTTPPQTEDAGRTVPPTANVPSPAPPPAEQRPLETQYGATATVRTQPRGALRFELEEMREMPGAFGDPFRAIDSLPGVVPIFTGLPYFYLRGSPPSGTIYVYDDIQMPALFHYAFGPSVIHPRMIGPLHVYAGAAPARYGRHTGGVVVAEGPDEFAGMRATGEVELRLLDVSGMIEAPLAGGSIAVSGRYGYPALLLSVLSADLTMSYWDYQLRLDIPVGLRDRAQVVAFGSYDLLATDEDSGGSSFNDTDSSTLQFHRVELRYLRRIGAALFGAALRLGFDESTLNEEFRVQSASIGPRLFLAIERGTTAVRFGADLVGTAGSIETSDFDNGGEDDDEPLSPGNDPLLDSVAARNVGGIYGQATFRPMDKLEAQMGVRADFWSAGTDIDAALDPRLRLTFEATRKLDLHIAAGVTRQPAVFIIPLPGLTDVALDRGLQTATQMDTGIELEAPWSLRAEARFFFHHYSNLLFPDALLEETGALCTNELGCTDSGIEPRTDGIAYGTELYVRRSARERLSGWISYTLGWAHVDNVGGAPYTPVHDVRHVANVIASYDFGGGFALGLRFHARSGKPFSYTYVRVRPPTNAGYDSISLVLERYQQRQPWFVRGDLQLSYSYRTSWGSMRWMLEVVNFTLSREPGTMTCDDQHPDRSPVTPCTFDYSPLFALPNLGVRGEF